MDTKPFFSIFIPAKGRPLYLDQAIQSVLLQEFENIELVISNNGADILLREVAERYLYDIRIKYIEQPDVLNMPMHWETVSQSLIGDYVLVLTDRSVLKQGALRSLHSHIVKKIEFPDVVSWPWDIYYDHLKVLQPYNLSDNTIHEVNSNKQLIDTAKGLSDYPYSLPRGLNSCVKNSFISEMRLKYGSVFKTLNPDFTFGYLCLLNSDAFDYIGWPLFISQGLKVSNGGNSFGGDASPYFNSLDIKDFFKHVPIKVPMVTNSIHEDFLAMASMCGRNDLIELWNRENYYLECLAEVDAKKTSGILDVSKIKFIESAVLQALSTESSMVKIAVKQKRTNWHELKIKILGFIKKILKNQIDIIRCFVLIKRQNGINYTTVLEAAGYTKQKLNKDC